MDQNKRNDSAMPRRPWLSLAALALILALGGCATTPPPPRMAPAAEPIVLDYRNGWYHRSDGSESYEQLGRRYQREGGLVAKLNQAAPGDIPTAETMVYIPPSNNIQLVREALERVQGHPELIPRTPWIHKPADAPLKTVQRQPDPPRKSLLARLRQRSQPTPREVVATAPAPRPRPQAPSSNSAPSGFEWPVRGEIMARFKEGWNKACHGIEIAAAEGQPVQAARPGRVLVARDFPGYGKMVLIDHGDGYASVYGYNSDLLVREDQAVRAGDQIASVGRPSSGSRSRLFFQIRRDAQPVDPLLYLTE